MAWGAHGSSPGVGGVHGAGSGQTDAGQSPRSGALGGFSSGWWRMEERGRRAGGSGRAGPWRCRVGHDGRTVT